jgi:Flp pilus assembly protein TadD
MSRMTIHAGTAKAIRYAITGALTAGLLAGCAASSHMARAGKYATKTAALSDRSVQAAEQAAAKAPNDAAARVALGQAYLDAGRFQSASTSFSDAVQLGDASGRTQLSLALAQIGAGNQEAAIGVLDSARDTIPASDRGLAIALAGQPGRGVAILIDALRGGEDSPKLRQNLAFAYALSGQWREARIAMAQDVPADQISDRIGAWAEMSRPEDVQKRVASLLNVPTGIADAGQPTALALNAPAEAEQLAAAPAAPASPAGELPPVDQSPAAVEPVPAPVEPAAVFAAVPAPKPSAAVFDAAFAPKPTAAAAVPAPRAVFAAHRVAKAAPVRPAEAFTPVARGSHMVQLGSFSSEANARRAWGIYTARNPELGKLRMTITPAVVNGRSYWRVAAAGLDGQGAQRLCSGLKNRGGACFAYAATRTLVGARPALAMAEGGPSKARR